VQHTTSHSSHLERRTRKRDMKLLSSLVLLSLLLAVVFVVDVKALNITSKEQFALNYPHIIGYWGATPGGHQSTVNQLKQSIGLGYNVIIYAFYDVDANGGLNQDPGSAPAPRKSDIGGSFTYLISLFGGQNGAAPSLTINPDTWATNMFNNFKNLRSKLDLDGTPNQVECGLRTFFKLMHQGGFVVLMAPQTTAITPQVGVYSPGSWNSYVPLADTSVAQYVDIVAVQLYNNAVPFNSPAQYASALTNGFKVSSCPCSASCQVKLSSKQISFGYPASNGAAPSGCPGLPGGCPYGNALTSLYNGNSALGSTGGVMTWSIEWDQAAGWPFVRAAKAINFH